jgi:hypothetical protein
MRPRWYRRLAVALILVMFVVLGAQLIVSTSTTTTTAAQAVGFTTSTLLPVTNMGDAVIVSKPSVTEATNQHHPDSRRRPPPDADNKPHCLVFFHVPKTAGTSVRRLLRQLSRELDWKFQMWYDGDSQLDLTTTNTNWTEGVLHAGHITPRFLEVTRTQSCLRLTVLREPVDRVISLHFFLRKRKQARSPSPREATTTSKTVVAPAWQDCLFNRNFKTCDSWHQYQNEVTRLFATSSSSNNDNNGRGGGDGRNNQNLPWTAVTRVPEYVRMPMNATTLAAAQQFLWRETDLVCFQDHLDACEQAVRRLLSSTSRNMASLNKYTTKQATAHTSIPKVNVNAKRPTNITADIRDQIRDANAWDVQLYDWARETFLDTTDID